MTDTHELIEDLNKVAEEDPYYGFYGFVAKAGDTAINSGRFDDLILIAVEKFVFWRNSQLINWMINAFRGATPMQFKARCFLAMVFVRYRSRQKQNSKMRVGSDEMTRLLFEAAADKTQAPAVIGFCKQALAYMSERTIADIAPEWAKIHRQYVLEVGRPDFTEDKEEEK